jgi:hypothetical protein
LWLVAKDVTEIETPARIKLGFAQRRCQRVNKRQVDINSMMLLQLGFQNRLEVALHQEGRLRGPAPVHQEVFALPYAPLERSLIVGASKSKPLHYIPPRHLKWAKKIRRIKRRPHKGDRFVAVFERVV